MLTTNEYLQKKLDTLLTEVSPFLEVFRTKPNNFFSFKTQITSSWHGF